MKTSNKMLIGTSALVAIIFAGAYSFSSAYRGDYTQKGPNYSEERHEAMEKAFENNDYNEWKSLMAENSRGRVRDVINEENFSKFAEAHRLMEEGKYEEAKQIREDLGLGLRNGEGKGFKGQGRMNDENRGHNRGGNFIDEDGDGTCDNLNR
ncbi:MAG: hypothetical protein PHX98_02845 [Candidatus Moranbacteria bacterium]|nr:hypothetical protein [Candidatus Moranbacteria bacterium]